MFIERAFVTNNLFDIVCCDKYFINYKITLPSSTTYIMHIKHFENCFVLDVNYFSMFSTQPVGRIRDVSELQ